MKQKSWSEYYESTREHEPWGMYAWSMGKTLHIPFNSLKHVQQNEQILEPMNLWAIVYELSTAHDYNAWCKQHTSERYCYTYQEHTPVPVILQFRQDVLQLVQTGKLDALYHNNMDPTAFVNKRIEENQ